ncbi:ATP-binding protein [Paraburkholderia sp. CNPSo 3274]|uniref:ATP-binding protein n=1 Tax=Paraburkholderia sp. CNPSo 3274 TaxID=2940932 RepID=UPI0020B8200E|nr:ATP-binding protein [Paraburkholderia sp. CNPSo 3274]MCP3709543.1 ATP-binding protein [Paraburkholderia sp. CNPSo 3274]
MLVQVGFRYLGADSPLNFGDTAFDPASATYAAQQQDAELELELAAQGASVRGIAPLVSIKPDIVNLGAEVTPRLRDAIWAPHAGTASNASYLRDACSSGVTCMKRVAHWFDARFAALMLALCVLLLALRAWWLRTVRHDLRPRTWTLSVRDHGEGVAASLPEGGALASPLLASRAASLRLDSHWGMGLSIVRRLARLCNAKLKIGNHPEGGLWVRVIVPMDKARHA